MTTDDDEQEWVAPAAGSWELDALHQSTPFAHVVADLLPAHFGRGIAEMTARYGLPIERLEVASVRGWFYQRPVMAGLPDRPGAGKEPPAVVVKLVMRVVPELRRRNRRAATAVAERLWCADAARWRRERDDWAARLVDRQRVDLASLDDVELAGEQERVADLLVGAYAGHLSYLGLSLGVGAFLAAAPEWDLEAADLAPLLEGHSPSSAAAGSALRRAAEASSDAGVDLDTVLAGPPGSVLGALRGACPEAASILDGYLERHGYRMTDPSLCAPLLAEHPDLLARGLRRAALEVRAERDPSLPPDPVAVRDRVPVDQRGRFDQLLADAVACYAAADDNTDHAYWAGGVFQRVLHESGRRLAAGGVIDRDLHVVDLTLDEICAALRGDAAPDLAARARARFDERVAAVAAGRRAPDHLGPAPGPQPSPTVFPSGMRAVMTAMQAVRETKLAPGDAASGEVLADGSVLARGHGIGTGPYTGRACVAVSAQDAMDRLGVGDVLVCPVTSPAFDALFAVAGAVVTEQGGLVSHTAVMARELGLPAVVGTGAAPIVDGAEITVVTGR